MQLSTALGFIHRPGRQWSYAQLRQLLLRARNAGLSELGGEIVGKSAWPAIVAEADW